MKETTVILDDHVGNSWQFDIKPGDALVISPFPGKVSEMRLGPRQVRIVQQVMGQFIDTIPEPSGEADENENRIQEIIGLIEDYGFIDGADHKQWVIDQIARVVMGDRYSEWVAEMGEDSEGWDEGIAP